MALQREAYQLFKMRNRDQSEFLAPRGGEWEWEGCSPNEPTKESGETPEAPPGGSGADPGRQCLF